jgi:hypothetical protein
VVRGQPRPPLELVPGIPAALERLILRCLRKDPGRRFYSMVDVRVELEDVQAESDSQVSATAGVAVAKRRSWCNRVAWVMSGGLSFFC